MKNNIKFTFSVEKGFRTLENTKSYFHFFMIQFELPQALFDSNKEFYFSLENANITSKKERHLFIDKTNSRVITENSHEDPIVFDQGKYFIGYQIEVEDLKYLTKLTRVYFKDKNKNIIFSESFMNLDKFYKPYESTHYSHIRDNILHTNKICTLTLHLGNSNGEYSEINFTMEENSLFDFSDYLNKYEYIGLQCSYENEIPELEEKHIIIGQKGIYLSGRLELDDGTEINPPFNFKKQYQKIYNQHDNKFIEIKSINELILFYKNKNSSPKFFESNINFLTPGYLNQLTYNQDGLYSKQSLKKSHFSLNVCQDCEKNFKCLQAIPSGLSFDLYKKNIALEDNNSCSIYQILK